MSAQHVIPPAAERPESIDAVLARNLLVARVIAGVTQQEVATSAQVSRATVAQIETGFSDPKISTILDIARALGLSPLVLLAGLPEVRALASLQQEQPGAAAQLPVTDVARMEHFVRSGMIKDRIRAGRIGASLSRLGHSGSSGYPPVSVALTAAIFSATLPGPGTAAGAALGRHLGDQGGSR